MLNYLSFFIHFLSFPISINRSVAQVKKWMGWSFTTVSAVYLNFLLCPQVAKHQMYHKQINLSQSWRIGSRSGRKIRKKWNKRLVMNISSSVCLHPPTRTSSPTNAPTFSITTTTRGVPWSTKNWLGLKTGKGCRFMIGFPGYCICSFTPPLPRWPRLCVSSTVQIL